MKIPTEASNRVKPEDIIKRFLLIFFPLAVFFGSLTFLLYFKDAKTEKKTIENNEIVNIQTQTEIIAAAFNAISMDLKFQAVQNELMGFLQNEDPEYLRLLTSEWQSLCTIKPFYYKIRYIDENGVEILNVSRDPGGNRTSPFHPSGQRLGKRLLQKNHRSSQ